MFELILNRKKSFLEYKYIDLNCRKMGVFERGLLLFFLYFLRKECNKIVFEYVLDRIKEIKSRHVTEVS